MSNSKSRLGRGLGGLISGSRQTSRETKPVQKVAAKTATGKTKPKPGKPTAKPGKPTAKSVAKPAQRKGTALGGNAEAPRASTVATTLAKHGYAEIPLDKLVANPYQPRREIDPKQIEELASSIESEGLLQPIVVRERNGKYELIAGERRWRAFQFLKQNSIAARIIDASDASSAALALIENLQREGLNPIDEAMGYASLINDFDLTQEAAAERVGKARASVANALRLLSLESEIQGYLSRGLLSTGHAKVLLGVASDPHRKLLARRIIESGMSVRETERQVKILKDGRSGGAGNRKVPAAEDTAVRDLEKRISRHFSAPVSIRHHPKKGRIAIEYFGNEDLDRILELLRLPS